MYKEERKQTMNKLTAPQYRSSWQEFDVDDNGRFFFNGISYMWFQWIDFLVDNGGMFNNFGGWSYGDDDYWPKVPRISYDGVPAESINRRIKDAMSLIPVKIRIWRYAE